MTSGTVFLTLLLGAALTLIEAQLSLRRWLRWARQAADFATTEILNAEEIDSDDAVDQLRAKFDGWSTIVRDSTARYCHDDDAVLVQFFDTTGSPDLPGFNDEHRYVRQASAERVRRLLDLAERLERRQTWLRPRWVPRLG